MARPFRVWCAAVVGLGVVVGCAKKPDESVSNSSTPPAPAPAGGSTTPAAGVRPAPPTANNGKADGTDWTAMVAPVSAKKPEATAPVAVAAPPVTNTAPPTTGSGEISVANCKFDGVEKAIEAARGKVVLIDCWATWCGPCVASFPKLVEKHQKYVGKGLAVISMSMDKTADAPKVIAFLKQHKATFTNLHLLPDPATGKGMKDKFEYKGGIPHAVLFDRTGNRVWSGHPMKPELTAKIEAELAKGGAVSP